MAFRQKTGPPAEEMDGGSSPVIFETILAVPLLYLRMNISLHPLTTILFAAFICVFAAGCGNETVKSSYTPAFSSSTTSFAEQGDLPVHIEGDGKGLLLTARNDSGYLFLHGRSANAEAAFALSSSGITVWISPEKHNVKTVEFHFPSRLSGTANLTRGGFWRAMTDSEKAHARNALSSRRKDLVVTDNKDEVTKLFPPDSGDGFSVVNTDSTHSGGGYAFTIRIPLHLERYFPGLDSLIGQESVNLGIGLLERPERQAAPRVNRGFGGEGMGDGGYGAFGGMGGYGSMRRSRRMLVRGASSAATELWFDVALAKRSL